MAQAGGPVPNPNDPSQVIKSWLASLMGGDEAETEAVPPAEPNSSDRTADTVAAQKLFKNPYQDKTASPPEQVGKYKFDPMLIEGNLPGKAPSSQPKKSSHSISSEKNFKAGSPTDLYLNKKIMTPEYLGMKPNAAPGVGSPGPADEFSPGDVKPGLPEASSAPTKSSDDFDLDKIMAEVQKLLNGPTDEKWDLSPAIAWSDSISGNNVLKGYKRPQSREEIIKDRQDLALKLGKLAETRDYHNKMAVKGVKDRAQIDEWNKEHPDMIINPVTGQFFSKKDDWMDKLMGITGKAGIEGKQKEKETAEAKAQADSYISEWKKQNPGKKPEPYWDGKGISWTKEPGQGRAAPKLPKVTIQELKAGAEADFTGFLGAYNPEEPKHVKFLADLRKMHMDANAEAQRTGKSYYDIIERERNILRERQKAGSAKPQAPVTAKEETKPSLLDKIGEFFNRGGK